MKPLLLALFTLPALSTQAQIMGKSVPEYTTHSGTLFRKGDTLRLGLGTDIGGRFKYISIPPNAYLGMREHTPYNANYANQRLRIKDLRTQSMNKKMAPRTLAVVNSGGINAQVDLDAAEDSGEIKTTHNQTVVPVQVVVQPGGATGVADELLKLKKLLDSGVITQAEFDAQKKKLLGL